MRACFIPAKIQAKNDYDEAVRILGLFVFAFFASCSSVPLDAMGGRRAEYDAYLADHLKSDRLYIKLRETAHGRALLITPKVTELQAKVAPGFELAAIDGKTRVIISLEMQDWARFSITDYKFYLAGVSATSVKEIVDEQLIRTLYPFAFPHDRVFIAEFEGNLTGELKAQTSPGQFIFNLSGDSL